MEGKVEEAHCCCYLHKKHRHYEDTADHHASGQHVLKVRHKQEFCTHAWEPHMNGMHRIRQDSLLLFWP